ncbi:MAG TPA: helix-turn-helix domain-containing protein [Candidatus Limnocylindrales bacterium]|nr:helix-turn-helix domain-containing protein [Candidatus Limnocylindrales bacterium]
MDALQALDTMTLVTNPRAPGTPGTTDPRGPLEAALERVGDRWSLLLVDALLTGGRRFGELRDELPGLAPNILTERLRRLEREGIVVATPYSTRPPRMEYSLTGDGRDLASALRLLADWGARRQAAGEPLRHDRCGTPVEARWYCPTCAVAVSDAETDAGGETRLV